ncbi:hypothetical protein ACVGV4_03000, partial [Enterobacter hormaechei]
MFSIIYHAGAAVLFLVMSLAGGARLLLHIHENNTIHLLNKNRLWNVSTKHMIWAVAHAKKHRYQCLININHPTRPKRLFCIPPFCGKKAGG